MADQAMADRAKENKTKKQNMYLPPEDSDYSGPTEQEVSDWMDIYNGSLENHDGMINEDGFGDMVRGDKQITKGDATYMTNPQHFASVGPDAAEYDGPVRVGKMSMSPELEKLNDMKIKLERLERKVHKAQVKRESTDFKKEMASLRKQIHELSEKIQSKPDTDVT